MNFVSRKVEMIEILSIFRRGTQAHFATLKPRLWKGLAITDPHLAHCVKIIKGVFFKNPQAR